MTVLSQLAQESASRFQAVNGEVCGVVYCGKCREAIVPEEGFGFVRFKIPGTEAYTYFHYRSRATDCWEAYLKEGK